MAAIAFAVVIDVIQLVTAPVIWLGEVLDIFAMIVTMRLLGFHWLLLPTIFLESVPVVHALPTWTGCVFLVTRLRYRQQEKLRTATTVSPNIPPKIETR